MKDSNINHSNLATLTARARARVTAARFTEVRIMQVVRRDPTMASKTIRTQTTGITMIRTTLAFRVLQRADIQTLTTTMMCRGIESHKRHPRRMIYREVGVSAGGQPHLLHF